MATHIESEIRKHLLAGTEVALIADWLIKEWMDKELSSTEIQSLFRFLFENGFLASFYTQIVWLLKNGREIPLTPLFEALVSSESYLDRDLMEEFLTSLPNLEKIEFNRLRISKKFESLFAEKRDTTNHSLYARLMAQIEKDLKWLHSNEPKLDSEPSEEVKSILRKYPNHPDLKKFRVRLVDDSDAIPMGAERTSFVKILDEWERQSRLDAESAKDEVIADFKKLSKKYKHSSQDIVISLVMMEAYEDALQILEKMPTSKSTSFLKLQILLQSKNYLKVLTWADQIDNSAPEKSEETIETMYYRAQALWHLGEKRTAKEIMTKLSDVQPDYRSASLILRDWEESES